MFGSKILQSLAQADMGVPAARANLTPQELHQPCPPPPHVFPSPQPQPSSGASPTVLQKSTGVTTEGLWVWCRAFPKCNLNYSQPDPLSRASGQRLAVDLVRQAPSLSQQSAEVYQDLSCATDLHRTPLPHSLDSIHKGPVH